MKRQSMIFFAAMTSLIISLTWISGGMAGERTPDSSSNPRTARNPFPLNRNCVVTVDSQYRPKPVVVGDDKIVTGFAAPDTVEGELILMDPDWLVIRDGLMDNWISRDKVMMIHVTN